MTDDPFGIGEVYAESAPKWYGADEAGAWAAGWNACRRALSQVVATSPTAASGSGTTWAVDSPVPDEEPDRTT